MRLLGLQHLLLHVLELVGVLGVQRRFVSIDVPGSETRGEEENVLASQATVQQSSQPLASFVVLAPRAEGG